MSNRSNAYESPVLKLFSAVLGLVRHIGRPALSSTLIVFAAVALVSLGVLMPYVLVVMFFLVLPCAIVIAGYTKYDAGSRRVARAHRWLSS